MSTLSNGPRTVLMLGVGVWLCACAVLAPAAGPSLAPALTPGELPAAIRRAPERYVLVTVPNEPSSLGVRAGSTLRGYDGAGGYSVSNRARSATRAIASDYGLKEVAAWPIVALRVHCVVFEIGAAADRAALLAKLATDARISLAQPLQTFRTSTRMYNDPYVGVQHSVVDLSIAAAHEISTGRGVRVAIVDTGIDFAHPDLQGRVRVTRNFVDADLAQFARDRHGTAVAGVVAAVANNGQGIVGVAPGVELLAFKSCWETGGHDDSAVCNSFTLAQGLSAALAAHADVINLSLTGPADPLLSALVSKAIAARIAVVGATGMDNGFPGGVAGVIAVDTAELAAIASHVKHPANACLHAPGRDILTLVPGGRYDFASGSSLAAAHATGIAALLLSKQPPLTPSEIGQLLLRSTAVVSVGKDAANSINACGALTALIGKSGCR